VFSKIKVGDTWGINPYPIYNACAIYKKIKA
jgi:hypothetical protein